MNADLRDTQFKNNPNAVLIKGMYSEPYMHQFEGVGYSQTPFQMKAIMVDGVVYIPDPLYTRKTKKLNRDYSAYPMVEARIQPPEHGIIKRV